MDVGGEVGRVRPSSWGWYMDELVGYKSPLVAWRGRWKAEAGVRRAADGDPDAKEREKEQPSSISGQSVDQDGTDGWHGGSRESRSTTKYMEKAE